VAWWQASLNTMPSAAPSPADVTISTERFNRRSRRRRSFSRAFSSGRGISETIGIRSWTKARAASSGSNVRLSILSENS